MMLLLLLQMLPQLLFVDVMQMNKNLAIKRFQ